MTEQQKSAHTIFSPNERAFDPELARQSREKASEGLLEWHQRQRKEEADFCSWADAKFGPAPGVIPQHERYASLFEVWQARAAQDKSAELLEALEEMYVALFIDGCAQPKHMDKARAAISKARGE